MSDKTPAELPYARRLGAQLRQVRQSRGLSLADVEHKSRGVWKAVVIGSYERGDRAVTVVRLAALADWYGVPVAELLPDTAVPTPQASIAEATRHVRMAAELLGALDPETADGGEAE